jgi:hypothetical protein
MSVTRCQGAQHDDPARRFQRDRHVSDACDIDGASAKAVTTVSNFLANVGALTKIRGCFVGVSWKWRVARRLHKGSA